MSADSRKKFKTNFITDNLVAKIISLALAILLSLYVTSQEDESRDYRVPLRVVNLPADLLVAGDVPKEVILSLKAKKNKFLLINPKILEANIDLGKRTVGSAVYKLTLNQELPEVQWSIKPPAVEISLEPPAIRTVKINPVVAGTPMPGFYVIGAVVSPADAEIRGPVSVIRDVTAIATETVLVDRVQSNFERDVALIAPDNVTVPSYTVHLSVRIGAEVATNIITNIAPHYDLSARRLVIVNKNDIIIKRVIIRGARQTIEQLSADQIAPKLIVKDITKPGTFRGVKIALDLPPGVELVSIEPETFDVRVIRK
ncbi:MAG: CdaR family protein [Spirochaetota bacterium]